MSEHQSQVAFKPPVDEWERMSGRVREIFEKSPRMPYRIIDNMGQINDSMSWAAVFGCIRSKKIDEISSNFTTIGSFEVMVPDDLMDIQRIQIEKALVDLAQRTIEKKRRKATKYEKTDQFKVTVNLVRGDQATPDESGCVRFIVTFDAKVLPEEANYKIRKPMEKIRGALFAALVTASAGVLSPHDIKPSAPTPSHQPQQPQP